MYFNNDLILKNINFVEKFYYKVVKFIDGEHIYIYIDNEIVFSIDKYDDYKIAAWMDYTKQGDQYLNNCIEYNFQYYFSMLINIKKNKFEIYIDRANHKIPKYDKYVMIYKKDKDIIELLSNMSNDIDIIKNEIKNLEYVNNTINEIIEKINVIEDRLDNMPGGISYEMAKQDFDQLKINNV
jgi:hypothetical protein